MVIGTVRPGTREAYRLFQDGAVALARVERNGIRVDEEYLRRASERTGRRIEKLESFLHDSDVWRTWKKAFGDKAKLGSRVQLADVIFDRLGYESRGLTRTERKKADEAAFAHVTDLPFIGDYFRAEKLRKVKTTYLDGIRREICDGLLHPVYNLNMAITFRSSADSPNFQNIVVRDAEAARLIRSAFVPRPGRRLVENDFSAHEFRISAVFWRDPAMMSYAADPAKDVHRDQAMDCYLLPAGEVSKDVRYCAKNKFVFPVLYGSYYVNCAPSLWAAVDAMKLKTNSGVPLREHLAGKGIKKLGACEHRRPPEPGTFEHHIKQVEDRFMRRFPTFAAGKDAWYAEYRKAGEFKMMTGFTARGLYSKNFVLNAPVQGPSFHCLLWVLIRLQQLLRDRRMKALLVGQIHDCILADVPDDEVQDYLTMVRHVVEVELPAAWDWIAVPLEIEAEVTPLAGEDGGTWYGKESWHCEKGVWGPKG